MTLNPLPTTVSNFYRASVVMLPRILQRSDAGMKVATVLLYRTENTHSRLVFEPPKALDDKNVTLSRPRTFHDPTVRTERIILLFPELPTVEHCAISQWHLAGLHRQRRLACRRACRVPRKAVQAENRQKGVIWEGAVENAHGVRLATKLAKQYHGPPAWHSVRLTLADLGGLDGDRAE